MDDVVAVHGSIGEFVEAARAGANPNMASHRSGPGALDESGAGTFEEAVDWALYGGWSPVDVPRTVSGCFDDIATRVRRFCATGFEVRKDVAGFGVDVASYCLGEPEHMWQWSPVEEQVSRRALCMLVSGAVGSNVSSEELLVRGLAVIGLTRALVTLGYEMDIWWEITVRSTVLPRGWRDHRRRSELVRLHAAGCPMDVTGVEFALGSPAWLRRLYLAVQEGYDATWREALRTGLGYGTPVKSIHAETVGADLVCNLGGSGWGDGGVSDACDWIDGQLRGLGLLEEGRSLWEDDKS